MCCSPLIHQNIIDSKVNRPRYPGYNFDRLLEEKKKNTRKDIPFLSSDFELFDQYPRWISNYWFMKIRYYKAEYTFLDVLHISFYQQITNILASIRTHYCSKVTVAFRHCILVLSYLASSHSPICIAIIYFSSQLCSDLCQTHPLNIMRKDSLPGLWDRGLRSAGNAVKENMIKKLSSQIEFFFFCTKSKLLKTKTGIFVGLHKIIIIVVINNK